MWEQKSCENMQPIPMTPEADKRIPVNGGIIALRVGEGQKYILLYNYEGYYY